jgi:hypothetical protein
MKKWSPYYFTRIPKDALRLASELRALLESEKVDCDFTMRKLFAQFWPEFGKFWLGAGERVDWVTFALAPHNGEMFVQFVLKEHPEMIAKVDSFIDEWKSALHQPRTID